MDARTLHSWRNAADLDGAMVPDFARMVSRLTAEQATSGDGEENLNSDARFCLGQITVR
jgi:hypothetical protein